MSDATHKLCYFIHGKSNVSTVFVSPNETIGDLKEKIYNEAFESFITCNAPDLILTKVRYIMMSMNTNVTMASAGLLHS